MKLFSVGEAQAEKDSSDEVGDLRKGGGSRNNSNEDQDRLFFAIEDGVSS